MYAMVTQHAQIFETYIFTLQPLWPLTDCKKSGKIKELILKNDLIKRRRKKTKSTQSRVKL